MTIERPITASTASPSTGSFILKHDLTEEEIARNIAIQEALREFSEETTNSNTDADDSNNLFKKRSTHMSPRVYRGTPADNWLAHKHFTVDFIASKLPFLSVYKVGYDVRMHTLCNITQCYYVYL